MSSLSNFVLVFDLDDTLYDERDYLQSGRRYVFDRIRALYPQAKAVDLDKYITYPVSYDVWGDVLTLLALPQKLKESLLWMYRLHSPDISLSYGVKQAIKTLKDQVKEIVLLTDGRSVSQRMKLLSLGLQDTSVFISEEYESEKPSKKRFNLIETKWPGAQFVYIGDNLTKDFVAPNALGWTSVGLSLKQENIHQYNLDDFGAEQLPKYWISTISDLEELFSSEFV